MTKKKKLILIGGAVIVVGGLLYLNFAMKGPSGTLVQGETTMVRDVIEKVSASGRIQPKTKVDITSEINGEIVGLQVSEGDTVGIGDLLLVLDTVQLSSDVDQARYSVEETKARLEGSKITLDQNEEEYERQKRLYADKLTSETALSNAMYALRGAKASYKASIAQAKQARSRYEKQLDYLSKAKIVAPMVGVITFLDCEVGEIAAAQTAFTQGKTLMTVSDLSVFEVEVEVDETEIAKIILGQEAEIEVDAFPDTSFEGRVVEIGNTAILAGMGTQEQSTNFRVKVVFNEPNVAIRPGMSATVDVTTNLREGVLSIPYSAVVIRTLDLDSLEKSRLAESQESGSTVVAEVHAAEADEVDDVQIEETEREELKGVYVIREGKARFVQISTGVADRKYIEVTSGLSEGDSVIAGPYKVLRNVKDGEKVEIDEKKAKK